MRDSADDPHQVKLESSSRTVVLYANLAAAAVNPEEFVLHFGERDEEGSNTGTELARIYLSLPHAKRLALAIMKTIQSYEEIFGEVEIDALARMLPEARKRLGIREEQSDAEENK